MRGRPTGQVALGFALRPAGKLPAGDEIEEDDGSGRWLC